MIGDALICIYSDLEGFMIIIKNSGEIYINNQLNIHPFFRIDEARQLIRIYLVS